MLEHSSEEMLSVDVPSWVQIHNTYLQNYPDSVNVGVSTAHSCFLVQSSTTLKTLSSPQLHQEHCSYFCSHSHSSDLQSCSKVLIQNAKGGWCCSFQCLVANFQNCVPCNLCKTVPSMFVALSHSPVAIQTWGFST